MASFRPAVISVAILLALSVCLEVEAVCPVKNLSTSLCSLELTYGYVEPYDVGGLQLYANCNGVESIDNLKWGIVYNDAELQCGDGSDKTSRDRGDIDAHCGNQKLDGTIFTLDCNCYSCRSTPMTSIDLADCIALDSSLRMFNCDGRNSL